MFLQILSQRVSWMSAAGMRVADSAMNEGGRPARSGRRALSLSCCSPSFVASSARLSFSSSSSPAAGAAGKDGAGEEWQQYRDKATGKFFYLDLINGHRREHDNPPQWYMPAGQGADESVVMRLLRSDRWNANPHEKPSDRLILLNKVVAAVVLVGVVWAFATREEPSPDQQPARRLQEEKRSPEVEIDPQARIQFRNLVGIRNSETK